MIGKIKGNLEYVGNDYILVDVNGLSYNVYISEKTKSNLPKIGQLISVWTELIVREDSMKLIGFSSMDEREWYNLLISVQGVGNKASLNILSTLSLSQLSNAILTENISVITSAQGIGLKIAKRIITELKNNISNLVRNNEINSNIINKENFEDEKNVLDKKNEILKNERNFFDMQNDATSALVNLGYSRTNAMEAVSNILVNNKDIETTKEIIKTALKSLNKENK